MDWVESRLTWIPISKRVRSPEAASPSAACCDRICRVRVMRSVEGGSSSAEGFGFDMAITLKWVDGWVVLENGWLYAVLNKCGECVCV